MIPSKVLRVLAPAAILLPAILAPSLLAQDGGGGTPDSVTRFKFAYAPPGWVFFLVLLPALAAFVWLSYRATRLASPRMRAVLIGLRLLVLIAILTVLFGPQIEKRFVIREKRALALLVDNSMSMATQDAYPESSTRASVRRALQQAGSTREPHDLTRIEIAKELLKGKMLRQLAEEYRLYLIPFGEFSSTSRLPAPDDPADADGTPWTERLEERISELQPTGRSTDLAQALERAVGTWTSEELGDIFLLSDGRHNAATEPVHAALEAAAEGMRIQPVLIGDPAPPRNLSIAFRSPPPRVVLEGDQVTIDIEAQTRGYAFEESPPQLSVNLEARRIDSPARGVIRSSGSISLSRAASSTGEFLEFRGDTRLAFPHRLGERAVQDDPNPLAEGIYRVDIQVDVWPDEQKATDNHLSTILIVRDSLVRVLYIEGYPRWEYRSLVFDILLRSDRKIVSQVWLANASNIQQSTTFPPVRGSNTRRKIPPLEELPLDLDQLVDWCPECMDMRPLDKLPPSSPERKQGRCSRHDVDLEPRYHVVILGDIGPSELGRTGEEQKRFMRGLKNFVLDGGGLLLLSGELAMPDLYRNTELESLFPVQLLGGSDRFTSAQEEYYRPLLELTQDRQPHEICRLLEDPVQNRILWEDENRGLPHLLWYARVGDLRLGAQALLRHPSSIRKGAPHNKEERRNLDVLAAVREVGRDGRVLWLGFDSTWRWTNPYGVVHQERFYRNAIRWLALNRLLHPTRALRLFTNEPEYRLGEPVEVHLEVDAEYHGLSPGAESIGVWLQHLPPVPGGQWAQPIELARVAEGRAKPAAPSEGKLSFQAILPQAFVHDPGAWRVFYSNRKADPGELPLVFCDFEVVAAQREVENTHPDAKLLEDLAARSGGRLLEPAEFAPQLLRLAGEGTISKETGQEAPHPLWDNAWILFFIFVLLCAEWILRKRAQLI